MTLAWPSAAAAPRDGGATGVNGGNGGSVGSTDRGVDRADRGVDPADRGVDRADRGVDPAECGVDRAECGVDRAECRVDRADRSADRLRGDATSANRDRAAADPGHDVLTRVPIVRAADGLAVGEVGWQWHAGRRLAEVGFELQPVARGAGLAAEALAIALDRLWADAPRLAAVVCVVGADNVASQRVLRRCGFARDAGAAPPQRERWICRRPRSAGVSG